MAKRKTGRRPELDFSPEAPEIKERRHFFRRL
jgi:hypothetical protein